MKNKIHNQEKAVPVVKSGTAVIVLNKDRKILIGKRKGSHGAGIWAFPGGHIDFEDEFLKSGGEREVYEETWILCNVFSPDHYRDDLFATYDILSEDGSKRYTTIYLVAEYVHGGKPSENGKYLIPREPEKCEEWIWVSLDELIEICLSDKQKQWIPITKVAFYLNQMWNTK